MKNINRVLPILMVLSVFFVQANYASAYISETSNIKSFSIGPKSNLRINSFSTTTPQSFVATNKSQGAQTQAKPANSPSKYVQGEIIVKYKNSKINLNTSVGKSAAQSFNNSKFLIKKEDIGSTNISVLKISDGKSVETKIAELQNDPNVEYVQPNFKYYPAETGTNDTFESQLWGLDNTGQSVDGISGTLGADISAPQAWSISEGTSSVIVAVIDSGVAYNHPDLINNMWDGTNCKDENGNVLGGCNHGYDFEDIDKTPLPTYSQHGTHVAGIISAAKNNGIGVVGVAPKTRIMALKTSLTTSEVVKAINFARQNGVKIINASWGDSYLGGKYEHYYLLDQALYNSIKDFGGLFIAAAGNNSKNHDSGNLDDMMYPAGFRTTSSIGPGLTNIISVAATDQNDNLATFSDYGLSSVDVGAPGTNIYSTVDNTVINSIDFNGLASSITPPGWTNGGGYNNWGTWNTGSQYWGVVLYGDYSYPYSDNQNTTIASPSYNLSGLNGAAFGFDTACDTEYSTSAWTDYMSLEFSNDGGNNYTEAMRWDKAYIDYLNSENTADNNFAIYTFNNILIPAQYLTNNFKFRLRWVTNSVDNNHAGCLVDNITISNISNGSDAKYDYMYGTSMAAPHVAGLAALIEGYNPSLTLTQVKTAILNTGDNVSSLSGKTVTGKRINAYNALVSVNPAKSITSFTISGQVGSTTIDESNHSISLTMPPGSVVTALTPSISITGSNVSPASGVAHNFTSTSTYTVTAADGSSQAYLVSVIMAIDPDIAIAQAVIDRIAALPAVADLTLVDVATTTDIRGAYDTLTSSQKTLVTNISKLISTETQLGALASTTAKVIELEMSTSSDLTIEANLTAAETLMNDARATFTSVTSGGAKSSLITRFNTAAGEVVNASIAYDVARLTDDSIRGTNVDLAHIVSSLTNPLPTGTHASISWTSSSTSVVSNDGQTINRPNYSNGDATVTLTANISKSIPIICDVGSGGGTGGGGSSCSMVTGTSKNFTLTVISLPASVVASVTSTIYPVSSGVTNSETITNIPFETSKSTFLSNLTKGDSNQTWNETNISDPVVSGNTLVVTAQDGTSTITYTITVNPAPDLVAPIITLNGSSSVNITVGGTYTDEGATSIDDVDGPVIVTTSGTVDTNTVGTYILTYNTVDAAGNHATPVTRTVNVLAIPAPTITAPADIVKEAEGEFTNLNIGTATAVDDTDLNPVITPVNPPSVFPIGTTTVTWTATNSLGGQSSAVQTIVIVDTTSPEVIVTTPASPTKIASIDFTTHDIVSSLISTWCQIDSGEFVVCTSPFVPTLESGTHTVTVRGVDTAGNIGVTTTDIFTIDINAPTINISGPANKTTDINPSFTFESPDGGTNLECKLDSAEFASCVSPLSFESLVEDTHTFSVRATDEVGNTGVQSYNFVIDLTAPTIDSHPDISVSTTDASGAVVNYSSPNVIDFVDATTTATCSPLSGTTFSLGTTTVICNASDVAGNSATQTSFIVSVEDRTAPVITLVGSNPISLIVGGTFTDPGATALDNVDGSVTVISTSTVDASIVGAYSIIYTATDSANNTSTTTRVVNINAVPVVTPPGGGGGSTTPTYKKGDANKDGKIDKYDFSLMMANWGKIGTNTCDFNGDGKVDKYDFALLMSNWGL
jgi:subtilisin family serine protease